MTNSETTDIEQEILEHIDHNTGYKVPEFADLLNTDKKTIQTALESLMERGQITSTPDFQYRRARRTKSHDGATHTNEGVGTDTRTYCPETDTWYGLHEDATWKISYCPYCGDSATTDDHRIDDEICEVFCENTTMSTWRYCPSCSTSHSHKHWNCVPNRFIYIIHISISLLKYKWVRDND